MADDPAIARALTRLATERRGEGHPAADRLLAYHERTLPPGERESLQDHLAVCPRCARTVADMAAFPDVASPGFEEPVAEEELGEELDRLRRRIAGAVPGQPDSPRRATAGGQRWALLLAAGLAVALVALAGWSALQSKRLDLQRQRIAELEVGSSPGPRPDHSFEILSLMPQGTGAVRGEARTVVAVAARRDTAVPVVLNFHRREEASYEAELMAPSGEVLRTWRPLEPTSRGNFTVLLPPSVSSPGDYEVRLFRRDENARVAEARFHFRLEE